ncbi:hypothetical protein [Microlunatus ginsengisoli]|uniref:GNAT family N-acetyltransferase n=1 Tax=Microlunatus ginsengisoli TaxID=363863 RepID=A0ABP7AGZ9_9ACTN
MESAAELEILPVGPDHLNLLGQLFEVFRSTRHCWCTAFCSTSWQFAAGWYGGGNRRRFESLAVTQDQPMGVVAVHAGQPVGWCACGPRIRYVAALSGRSRLIVDRPRDEDEDTWLIPCTIVPPVARSAGHHMSAYAVLPMLRGAVELARDAGAAAIEAWPLAKGVRRPSDAHVGREGLFERVGFRRVQQPTHDRVIMRLEC